jgi:hypothetical protein
MTMGTSFCPRCGLPTEPDARFCRNCGQALTAASSAPLAPQPASPKSFTEQYGPSEPPPPPPAPELQPSRVRPLLIIGGFVLLGIAAAVFAVNQLNQAQRDVLGTIGNAVSGEPQPTPPPALSSSCIAELGDLVAALEDLDSRLSVGLAFATYSEKVGDLRVAYDRLDVHAVDAVCLLEVGGPAEDAVNEYITAYNTWNACIEDVDCDTDSITPDLQANWAIATENIDSLRPVFP